MIMILWYFGCCTMHGGGGGSSFKKKKQNFWFVHTAAISNTPATGMKKNRYPIHNERNFCFLGIPKFFFLLNIYLPACLPVCASFTYKQKKKKKFHRGSQHIALNTAVFDSLISLSLSPCIHSVVGWLFGLYFRRRSSSSPSTTATANIDNNNNIDVVVYSSTSFFLTSSMLLVVVASSSSSKL